MVSLSSLISKSQSAPAAAANDSTVIAFASDTQAPMWVETLWLKSHNNKTATKKLFDDVLQRRPHSFFLLGDVVNLGYSNRQWRPMDKYLEKLRDTGVQVHAILGNHEVMGKPKKGQQKFQKRFPNHVRTGYVEIVDSVAVVTRTGIADVEERTSKKVVTTGCGQGSVFGGLMDEVDQIFLPADARLKQAVVYRIVETIRTQQSIYKKAGSVHGCALFSSDGDLLYFVEDVGRHNAVDAIAGKMWLDDMA
ncbi:MAG: formate dehydrogenase accessory sulfurtransferase FdhD, partial [Bacteroidota bacterium]